VLVLVAVVASLVGSVVYRVVGDVLGVSPGRAVREAVGGVVQVLGPSAAWARTVGDPLDPADAPVGVRRAVFRAETAARAGELDRAAAVLLDALQDGHDHPAVRSRLGAYLLAEGDAAGAVVHLRTAAAVVSPAPPRVPAQRSASVAALLRDLGRAEYETGRFAPAARAFLAAAKLAGKLERAEGGAGADAAAGAERGAERGAEVCPPGRELALPSDPASRELVYYAAVAWSQADRPDSALITLAPLIASVPDTVPQEWVRALVSFAARAEQPAAADPAVRRLLRDHPDRPAAWRLASEQSQLAGDLARAAVRLQVAHWLQPLTGQDRRRLAELHAAAGAPRQAARVYAEMLAAGAEGAATGQAIADGQRHDRRHDRRHDLVRQLAVAWLQAHEPDSARVVLRAALAGAAPSSAAGEAAGEAGGEAGGREMPGVADAADGTADGIAGDTTDATTSNTTELLALLADLEYGERNWAVAADVLRRLTARDPERGRAWLLLGASELQLGDHDAARAALRRALEHAEVADRARRLLDQVPSR